MSREIKNIEEIKLILPDYVMDKLNQEEKKIVENSLEESAELKQLFEELSGTYNFVNGVKFKEPPAQYWSSLLPRIHERIESKQQKNFSLEKLVSYWKILVPIAAVILIALFYFLVINEPSETIITKKIEEIKKDSVKSPDNVKKEIVKENKEQEPVKSLETVKQKLPVIKNDEIAKVNDNSSNKIDEAVKKENLADNVDDTSVTIEEESVFGEAAGGIDEETESGLNRLNDREQELLIMELKNSNF